MKADLLTAVLTGAYGHAYIQADHFYNGYRKSITDVNWDSVIQVLLLSATQALKLYELNELYHDYNSWISVYGDNPDQWRYDRFSEMETILGKEKYKVFKEMYCNGENPAIYFSQNNTSDLRKEK